MRVLVTGGGGFIGRVLVEQLTASGHVVHRVVRGAPRDGEAGLDFATRRIDPSGLPGGSLDGIDAAINLAGEPITASRWSATKLERIRSSRILTTDILARALSTCNPVPRVLVSASAIGYYGNRGEEELVEESPPGKGFLAEVCIDWEAATKPAEEHGIRVVKVRTGIVLGRGGGSLAAQVPLFKLGLGGKLGRGQQWMSWIALADEVRVFLYALEQEGLSGPVNACAPRPVRNSEFTKDLATMLSKSGRLTAPATVLRLAFGKVADEMLLASQRVLPKRLQEAGFHYQFPLLNDVLDDYKEAGKRQLT
ncbi:MAG: TIGR01777 family oxidoreductase [Acidimicrobiales bacterium]